MASDRRAIEDAEGLDDNVDDGVEDVEDEDKLAAAVCNESAAAKVLRRRWRMTSCAIIRQYNNIK